MAANPKQLSYLSDKPANYIAPTIQPTSPWFPTGQFMGMDLSPKTQGLLGFAAGLPVGGTTQVRKQVGGKLLNLAHKLRGGSTRSQPAGISTVIEFLEGILKQGGGSPQKKKLAQDLITTFKTGKALPYSQSTAKLVKNIQANTKGVVPVAPGVQLRKELMINPNTQRAGQGFYVHMDRTPMIDIDLPIGPISHQAPQMAHGMQTRSDFMKRFTKFLYSDKGKSSKLKLYKTQGGYRLFDIGKRMKPGQYVDTGVPGILGQDKWYTNAILGRGQYSARLSPKPGRVGDYITEFDDIYGYGQTNPYNLQEVENFHDLYIDIIKGRLRQGDPSGLGGLFQKLKNLQ
jgi:hypothetical protein